MLALRLRDPGRLGSEGTPGSELKPGSELVDGRLGSEGVEGRLGTDVLDGRLGSEGVEGREGTDGTPGSEVGSPDGAVTQAVTPVPLEAVTDPDPAGVVALPPPEAVTGLGIEGVAGVLMHCEPVSVGAGGTGSEVRLGTEVGATALWVAALGNAFAATAATAATPAAPAVSRIIRP
jgi:hypothetical protein